MRRYPVLIDAVIQSSGIGLVGMYGSTMSLLAGRRVQDWNNGVYKLVKWGIYAH
jgi:aspartyl/asparaginyl beta-hydroxylase (cupin superfamily)